MRSNMERFSKDGIDADDDRKFPRANLPIKDLKKSFPNKKNNRGSLPDLSFAENSVHEKNTSKISSSFMRVSSVNSNRDRHCLSLDENVLSDMVQQSFLHSSCRHYCKSTSSICSLQDQGCVRALHTSELCQIALQINSQVDDEYSLYKDRLNCSCTKKKYHSWPKHANLTKHFKYHNYGLRDQHQQFIENTYPPVYEEHIPQLLSDTTRLSFNGDHWNLVHCTPESNKNITLNGSRLCEKSMSQPCLTSTKSETSLKSLSSVDLQGQKRQNNKNLDFVDMHHNNPIIPNAVVSNTKSKYDLTSITNEFDVFDEIYKSVFKHDNVADLIDDDLDQTDIYNCEISYGNNINGNSRNNDGFSSSIFNNISLKDFPLQNFDTNARCNPEITNLKRYESLVFSDTLETNSSSSFNDEITTDSGFSRWSDLSPLFNCLQLGIEAPLFKKRTDLMLQWFSDFSNEQRNIFIQRVLGVSSLPQMHMLSLKMENRLHDGCPINCRDMLQWLPANVVYQILDYLDPKCLSKVSKVNRTWYNYAVHDHLWQKFCRSPDYKLSSVRHREEIQKHTNIDGIIQWRDVFIERHCLRQNWMNGKCKVKTFVGHTQGVSCVQFDSKRIVSGSSDKTIMVWDLTSDSNQPVLTLVGHSGTVRCLQLIGTRLVSGSADNTIKVWDLSVGSDWNMVACRVTMIGHLDTVRCLQVDEEKVISGSYDKTIKVWDLCTGRCKLTLRGHSGAVLCVQFDEQKIVSGSSDNTIKVWSQFTGICLATFHSHHDAVTCLQFNNCHIISGSLDCTLKFWDLNSGKCVGTIDWIRSEGHTRVVRCLQADSWKIVSAGDDKTLKIWSLESGERFVTLHKHTDGVTCLRFDDFMIVSGSYDKTVKVWDFLP